MIRLREKSTGIIYSGEISSTSVSPYLEFVYYDGNGWSAGHLGKFEPVIQEEWMPFRESQEKG